MDILVGAQTQEEAAAIYSTILQTFHKANIKISGANTYIFPQETDVLGWLWKQGGNLLPSPTHQFTLKNTQQSDLVTIKDLRSWTGLYKTLLLATPQPVLPTPDKTFRPDQPKKSAAGDKIRPPTKSSHKC
jgi:hypothetical protein